MGSVISYSINTITKTGYYEQVYANGDLYKGEFRDGKRHGKGSYLCANSGNLYEGEWEDDIRHGIGSQSYKVDSKWVGSYEGSWKNNKKDGQGIYVYANGDVYNGKYSNGVKSGYGVYTFANKDRYEGEFLDDKFDGAGTLIVNKDTITGYWKSDKRNGKFLVNNVECFYEDDVLLNDFAEGISGGAFIATMALFLIPKIYDELKQTKTQNGAFLCKEENLSDGYAICYRDANIFGALFFLLGLLVNIIIDALDKHF